MPSDFHDVAAQKSIALDLLLNAWDAALAKGVAPELLASTAIFAALTDMVDMHGPDAVADFCAALPARIRAGEFTMRDE
ncbi:MAG: hypothetical protein SGJ23_01700 [Alphaproteobacteria bacterium]|nr:hypothetical protein [Alphaproteobacteria bacterium]